MHLTLTEQYAWCIYLSLTGLSWAFAGWVGVLLMNAGFWIGHLDVSFLDRFDQRDAADDALPDNVVPLAGRRRKILY